MKHKGLYQHILRTRKDKKENYFHIKGTFPIGIRSRNKNGDIIKANKQAYISGNYDKLEDKDFVWFHSPYNAWKKKGNNEVLTIIFLASPGSLKCLSSKNNIKLTTGDYVNIEEVYQRFIKGVKLETYGLKNEKVVGTEIVNMEKKEVDTTFYHVKLRGGNEFEVNRNHRIFVFKNGKIVMKYIQDLEIGEYMISSIIKSVYVDNTLPISQDFIDRCKKKEDWVNKRNLIRKYLKAGMRICNIAKELDLKPGTVQNYNKAYKDKIFTDDIDYNKYYCISSCSKIKKVSEVSEDLCWFIGILLSEGGLNVGYTVQVTTTECEDKVRRIVHDLFDIDYIRKEAITLIISNKTLKEFLKSIGLKMCKSGNKKIPKFMFNLDKKYKIALLRGLFDGDGCANKSGEIFYTSKSKRLRDDILSLLNDIGIYCKPTQVYNNKYKSYYYSVYVTNVEKFKNVIGFTIKRKQNNIICKDSGNSILHTLPVTDIVINLYNKCKPFKEELETTKFIRRHIGNCRNNKRIGKAILNKLLDVLSDKGKDFEEYKILRRILDTDLIFLPVTDINIEERNDYIYSLETDNEHNYFTGINGFTLVHNTVLLKRFAYYFFKQGVNILVFDPKSSDWELARRMGSGRRLHIEEVKDKVPVQVKAPSFVNSEMTPSDVTYFHEMNKSFFTEDIRTYGWRRIWYTLGFTAGATEVMRALIVKYNKIDSIFNHIMQRKTLKGLKMHREVERSILNRVGVMKDDNFFNDKYPSLKLKSYFYPKNIDNRKIVSLQFHSQEDRYQQVVVGNKYVDIFNMQEGTERDKSRGEFPPPVMVINDDASFYASERDMTKSWSVFQINNVINNWRSLNISSMYAVQNPELLHPLIFESAKYIFVSMIGNPDKLRDFNIDSGLIWVAKQLIYDPENHLVEYLKINPDRKSGECFFPLGSVVGHTW